jgi:hypothetical protein
MPEHDDEIAVTITDGDTADAESSATRDVYPPSPVHVNTTPGWIAPAALALAVLAAAGAGWALFKPASNGNGSAADPKGTVCTAFRTVSDAVSLQTNQAAPDLGPVTPVANLAIAANARLAMAGGANYLLDILPSNASADLATAVRSFAGDLNGIAMNALAGIPNDKPEQAALLKSAEESNKKIADLCK